MRQWISKKSCICYFTHKLVFFLMLAILTDWQLSKSFTQICIWFYLILNLIVKELSYWNSYVQLFLPFVVISFLMIYCFNNCKEFLLNFFLFKVYFKNVLQPLPDKFHWQVITAAQMLPLQFCVTTKFVVMLAPWSWNWGRITRIRFHYRHQRYEEIQNK